MKHARIAWSGAIQQAVESDGQLLITQGPHKGRLVAFDEVVDALLYVAHGELGPDGREGVSGKLAEG